MTRIPLVVAMPGMGVGVVRRKDPPKGCDDSIRSRGGCKRRGRWKPGNSMGAATYPSAYVARLVAGAKG